MPRDVTAAERKRLRDRVAQQNLRNRRQQYIQGLEDKVKRCQERHGDGQDAEGNPEREQLWARIQRLQEENVALRARQKKMHGMLSSMRRLLDDGDGNDDGDGDGDGDDIIEGKRHQHDTHGGKYDADNDHNGSSSQISVEDQAVDAATRRHQPQPLQSTTSIAATPHAPHADASTPAVLSNTDYTPWQRPCSATLDTTAAMTSFHAQTPLPNTPPETTYTNSPQDPLLDARLWNFLDLWTNYNDIDQLPVNAGASAAGSLAAGGAAPPTLAPTTGVAVRVDPLPAWAMIPKRVATTADRHYHPWERDMGAILDAPDVPSPLDLAFGSRRNFLANEVQVTLKHFFAGPAERLCAGILIYSFIKWRTKPSLERYNRLPDFIRPTPDQVRLPHPGCLDLMFWPRLRVNAVKAYAGGDVDKMMRTYCSCLRLRWPRDRALLVPTAEASGTSQETHELNPDFYGRYMDLANWGLTPEFQQQYPALLEGVDPEAIRLK